ncbi:MAG TPA: phosphoribosyltransferase family protein [Mycobacteriales bacterium]|nr:phosphoribosyltransferase family protein [Mycobacteriales bacterium]
MTYADRADAGHALAAALHGYAGRDDVVVLGLPRGGVPVAAVVAEVLGARLDAFVVRKVGHPDQPELALGAVASAGVIVVNERVVRAAGLSPADVDRLVAAAQIELAAQEQAYRGDRPPLDLARQVAILVDDGVATGASMRAAAVAARRLRPARLVAAFPVAPAGAAVDLARFVDEVVCPLTPADFHSVGSYYLDFHPTPESSLPAMLAAARRVPPGSGSGWPNLEG